MKTVISLRYHIPSSLQPRRRRAPKSLEVRWVLPLPPCKVVKIDPWRRAYWFCSCGDASATDIYLQAHVHVLRMRENARLLKRKASRVKHSLHGIALQCGKQQQTVLLLWASYGCARSQMTPTAYREISHLRQQVLSKIIKKTNKMPHTVLYCTGSSSCCSWSPAPLSLNDRKIPGIFLQSESKEQNKRNTAHWQYCSVSCWSWSFAQHFIIHNPFLNHRKISGNFLQSKPKE